MALNITLGQFDAKSKTNLSLKNEIQQSVWIEFSWTKLTASFATNPK